MLPVRSRKNGAEAKNRHRWSVERRAGRRHWPVIPGDPGIGPTARRATGAAFRTSASRRSAPLARCEGKRIGQTSGAKTRREHDGAWLECEWGIGTGGLAADGSLAPEGREME